MVPPAEYRLEDWFYWRPRPIFLLLYMTMLPTRVFTILFCEFTAWILWARSSGDMELVLSRLLLPAVVRFTSTLEVDETRAL